MLDHALPRIAEFTFLQLGTSRYITIDLSEVHARYYFVGFCRGVIVLAQKNPPHKIRLLNPLTKKSNTMFEAQMPSVFLDSVAVIKSPTIVFVAAHYPPEIGWVDEITPTKDIYEDWGEEIFSIENHCLRCITPFNGELYAVAAENFESGRIVCTNVHLQQRASTVKMETLISFPELGNEKFYLVKSDGDLLLVLLVNLALAGKPLVYRVDTQSRSLHPVSNIGSNAFFVNHIGVSPSTPECTRHFDLAASTTRIWVISEYSHDTKAWDEWPLRVDRIGNYSMTNEHMPYRLEDVLAAHYRRKEFNEYFLGVHQASKTERQVNEDIKYKNTKSYFASKLTTSTPTTSVKPSSFSTPPKQPTIQSRMKQPVPSTASSKASMGPSNVTYFKCGTQGHKSFECKNTKVIITMENGYIETLSEGEYEALVQAVVANEEDYDEENGEDPLLCVHDPSPSLVVTRVLTTQPQAIEDQRCNIFQTRGGIGGKSIKVIIDGVSCHNLASTELCEKLNLSLRKHPHPYHVQWLSDKANVNIQHTVTLNFKTGPYEDTIECDVIPMMVCHMLLGRPWQYDKKAMHDGHSNVYTFKVKDKKFEFRPMTPSQIITEDVKALARHNNKNIMVT
ncbi:hypothetical protein QYE76_045845 [Lolium multiflorum]|uniref:KIB1-4 beta-propeller domain-containing protein n=1 Tax=Lolium multiflorum TaxID=4521 RepID=A0AAD8TNR7_LOLMU|nr:hypothetical protein QYE76_045845 [Lolium multiflorum]